jgi:hypothetical protein
MGSSEEPTSFIEGHRDHVMKIENPVPVQIPSSTLNYDEFVWKVPGTHLCVPLLKVRGAYRMGEESAADRISLRMAIRRLSASLKACAGMIVDLTQVEMSASDPLLHFGGELLRRRSEPIFIVVPEADRHLYGGSIAQDRMCCSQTDAMGEVVRWFKGFRFDGGKGGVSASYSPRLESVVVEESLLYCEYFLLRPGGLDGCVGLVSFAGLYRRGSEGYADALFVKLKEEAFCEYFGPVGLVCDFRGVDYEWGDDLDPYPGGGQEHIPVRVLVDDKQFDAYAHVLGRDSLDFSLEQAIEFFRDAARVASKEGARGPSDDGGERV